MIKLIVFAVVGLVIGLGGGSGVAVMRAKKAVVAARDSTAEKDSTATGEKEPGDATKPHAGEGEEHAAVAAPDSAAVTHAAPTAPDSAVDPKTAPATTVAHAPLTVAPTVSKPLTSKPTPTAAVKPAADTGRGGQTPAAGRISKIFAAMSPKDASRVLEQLEDGDVQTVLVGLNDKQAAAILSGFPPARAAAISRAALRGKKATP